MSDREKIVERLEALDLGACEDSHERLAAICKAVSDPAYGWTLGACEDLRERLVRLIGGDVDGCPCEGAGHGVRAADGRADGDGQPSKIALMAEYHRGFVDGCNLRETATWQLSMERDGVVRELRKLPVVYNGKKPTRRWYMEFCDAIGVGYATTFANVRDRLIHLLGGDAPTSSDLDGIWQDGAESENKGGESASKMTKTAEIGKLGVDSTSSQSRGSSPMRQEDETGITDELRKYIDTYGQEYEDFSGNTIGTIRGGTTPLYEIADRIDEQAKLLEYDVKMWRDRAEDMRMERDELQARLDDYDKTHVALLKDANDEVIHVGDEMDCGEHFGIQEVEGFIHGAVAFTVYDPQPARICTCPAHMTRHYHAPTVEQVIRDLTLGKITELQAIERIEGING